MYLNNFASAPSIPPSPQSELITNQRLRIFTHADLDHIEPLRQLPKDFLFSMKVVASVLPFRVNQYVIDELIDWTCVPDDPMFQLTFPQPGMLDQCHFDQVANLLLNNGDPARLARTVNSIRKELNPHPAGQMELNIPRLSNGETEMGIQHKYRETVLFFPARGQTCHSYCSFCFRWAQFIGDKSLRMANGDCTRIHDYLRRHPDVTDLLITGGDPMVMKTRHLAEYLEPLLQPEFDHITSIRIGTKSLTFWPQRFVSDSDSGELLALLERLASAGKHVALMAHYNHWRELSTPISEQAIRLILATGAQIRSQGPVLAHINDNPEVWSALWKRQVKLGIIPYYMFVERDTGADRYFKIPLVRAWEIYQQAIQQVSGLGRTARGPSMSATPGKVEIQGIADIHGEKVFVLRFLQGRNPDWVNRPFFAAYDPDATWLDELKPAFGEKQFFFDNKI